MAKNPTNAGVPGESKLPVLARKRLEKFVTLAPKFLVNDRPETIHDLRVSCRRLQQAFRVLLTDESSASSRKLLGPPRKIRRALGECRNLDVSSELIEHRLDSADGAPVRRAGEELRAMLQEERAAALARARRKVAKHEIAPFIGRAREAIAGFDPSVEAVSALEQSVAQSIEEWEAAFETAREQRDVPRLHGLRIASKRLRYRTEMLASLDSAPVKPLVKTLKQFQDALGDWHDRMVLLEHMGEFLARPNFLVVHPDLARALLAEMEREKKQGDADVETILSLADKVDESCRRWRSRQEH